METKHIQLHDLANVLNLIDAAAKNGMVSGEAMSHMGAMRDRFMLNSKSKPQHKTMWLHSMKSLLFLGNYSSDCGRRFG